MRAFIYRLGDSIYLVLADNRRQAEEHMLDQHEKEDLDQAEVSEYCVPSVPASFVIVA